MSAVTPPPLDRQIRRTTCNRDCPDACRILATVEDGRVVRLQGDPAHPVTQGFLCHRTSHFLATQYAPDRLTAPLIRVGDRFQTATWDAALDLCAERLLQIRKESGPAAIFHYRSGGSLGLLKHLCDVFFDRFGPVTVKRGDICSGAGDAAQELDFGAEDSHDLFDLHHARQILLWGKNVFVSSPHTLPVLQEARRRGARLCLIDPVHHKTASLCERFHQPRPGGDFALAMAVGALLFQRGEIDPRAHEYCDHLPAFRALCDSRSAAAWSEEADVPLAAAEDLAERLSNRPCAILVGWGMGRRTNGAAIVRALDALSAISGNLGVSGGGVSFYFKRRGAFQVPTLGPAPRSVCEPLLGPELLALRDPPVRAVWITAGNPVAMLPESHTIVAALRSREFVVVADTFLTDTARLAHVVLPVTTLLEEDDILGAYGHHYLGAARPVVPPPEGVRSDLQILQDLAGRVGLGDALAGTPREWQERLLSPAVKDRGVTLEQIEAGPVKNPLAQPVLFADRRFPTQSGRVNLLTAAPPAPAAPDMDFPLWLLALSSERSQCSQPVRRPGQGPDPGEPATVTVHPAAAGGIPDGGLARLESRLSSLQVRVRHDARQRMDVALMAKGGHLLHGRCANALIRARTTDLGEGGALYEESVRLRPLADGE